MYSQSFTPAELYRSTTQVERRNIGLHKEELIEAIRGELGNTIAEGNFNFQIKHNWDLHLNGQVKGSIAYLCQNLILRKLHRNIKRIYSVQPADRDTIVKQMKLLLMENVEMRIVRLDIRHFYDNVNRMRILAKLIDDARLSHQSLMLLQNLFRLYAYMRKNVCDFLEVRVASTSGIFYKPYEFIKLLFYNDISLILL